MQRALEHPRPFPTGRHRDSTRSSRGRGWLVVLVVVALLLAPAEFSIGRALAAPGQATVPVRLVEWLRDHGGGPVVDVVEYWVYAHNRPGGAAPDPTAIPAVPRAEAGTISGMHPAPLPIGSGSPLPGDGTWVPSAQRVGGDPALYTAYFRPDPAAPSVIAGVAWMNQSLLRTRLVAGTADPVPPGGGEPADGDGAQVPASLRPALVATFNSGFKLKDAHGGYYAGGREVAPLRDGAASLVVDTSGRVTIGRWGRDVRVGPDTASVRQSLDLIVDGGAPVAGLDANSGGAWGTARNQLQYTWRSALGLDPGGNLIYVAADQVSLADLAHTLAAAGAVRGMQLDIHPATVGFLSYRPGQALRGRGNRLLPAMHTSTDRHLRPDQRDFLAVTVRTTPGAP